MRKAQIALFFVANGYRPKGHVAKTVYVFCLFFCVVVITVVCSCGGGGGGCDGGSGGGGGEQLLYIGNTYSPISC